MSGRWIRPGLRYHQQGPGHNIRWDRSRLAALAIVYNKEKEMANTGIEKRKANTRRRTHLHQRKSGLLLLFYFYFLLFSLHLSFMTSKALKLKKKTKIKKIRVRIRPFLDGYGLGTRIRTTLVRILIPGPATDPHLRIRSPVLALGARTTGLILHF